MLTRIQITNFKRFDSVDIELGKTVIFIGPNNSGKTTVLQALALWSIGLKRWIEKRGKYFYDKDTVTINRNDLISIPIPDANLLWRDLHTSYSTRKPRARKYEIHQIQFSITVNGINDGKKWSIGLEYEYANEESFYCRPLRWEDNDQKIRNQIPVTIEEISVAFLPPMSGLADREYVKQPGEINVLIGQGQTAQVLRNLCYQIYRQFEQTYWFELTQHMKRLFGVTLLPPLYIPERSEITMAYQEHNGPKLDLASSGRGLQQTLLLLTYLYANPYTVLLLDEPDAHLEVLRQRQIYQLLTTVAEKQGSQIIAASHSEIVLNEAADRDMVIAFVGKPHRIDDRGSQLLKALKEIGYEQYYQAEQTGWVLYLEGSTDLAILQAFAKILKHPAEKILECPFVHYVCNLPQKARDHFFGLRDAYPGLVGFALFDWLEKENLRETPLKEMMWHRREIENYLCMEEVLIAYARAYSSDKSFAKVEADSRERIMRDSIQEISSALKTLRRIEPWSADLKATDDFLDPLFEKYFEKQGLPNLLRKTDYHILAHLVPLEKIDPEIVEKLDAIVEVADKAKSEMD